MSLHLFTSGTDARYLQILEALERQLPGEPLHVYRSVDELLQASQALIGDQPLVLMVGQQAELETLVGIGEQLRRHRLVVVLQRAESAAVEMAHLLRPRVLFVEPAAPSEVAAVVAKMLSGGAGRPPRPEPRQLAQAAKGGRR
jgi:hypothetical protein